MSVARIAIYSNAWPVHWPAAGPWMEDPAARWKLEPRGLDLLGVVAGSEGLFEHADAGR
jgi:hypothetical protein